MTRLQKSVLAVATICLGYLLWKTDPHEIWGYLRQIGWGMVLVLAQEIVPHTLNALGWKFSFLPGKFGAYSLSELIRLRIAGDGVNYLTPSATIAGEFMRAAALSPIESTEVRYGSVAVAKVSQAIAQLVFILIGLAWLIVSGNPLVTGRNGAALRLVFCLLAGALAALLLGCVLFWRRLNSRPDRGSPDQDRNGPTWLTAMGDVPRQSVSFMARHPLRFSISAAFFGLGYAWSSVEGFLICQFLGVPVAMATAVIIEVLSNVVDTLLFMVPMKVGTQEGGKTAIFIGLGLQPAAGFAFGVVRHAREIAWGAFGLILCYAARSRSPNGSAPPSDPQRDPKIGGKSLPASILPSA